MIRHDLMYRLMTQGGYTVQEGKVEEATVETAIPGYSSIHSLPIPWVEPEDVSAAVLYLLGESGRYITGTELAVNGGYNRAI
jgi:(+)-trans-carveol dehydrogenase